jgi:hypothetical protein
MPDPKKHPSGRPIHRFQRGIISQYNAPRDDYVTPSLRRGATQSAIGFTVDQLPGTEAEES